MTRSPSLATRASAGGLAALLAAGALLTATSAPAFAADRTPIANGTHVDSLYPEIVGGELVVNSHLDSGSVSPDSIVHVVPDDLKATLPAGYESFLAPAGTDVWVASQSGGDAGPYAGWSTYGLGSSVGARSVDFTLAGVDGPGDVAVAQTDSFGKPVPKFSLKSGQLTVTESANAHVHANWMFTAPGAYALDFDVTARMADGSTKTAATTLHWQVGEAAPEVEQPPAPVEQSLTLSGLQDQYTVGDQGSLTVTPSEGFAPGHYHWLGKAPGAPAFGELGSTTDTFTFVAGMDLDGMQVKASTHGTDGDVETETVTLHVVPVAGGGEQPGEVELSISTPQETWLIGQSVTMAAVTTPASDLTDFRWFIQREGQDEAEQVWGQTTANFRAKPELDWDGATFTARLYDAAGTQVAESAPLSFAVEQIPEQGTIVATSDKDSYAPGETASFSGVLAPSVPEVEAGHPHWYVKKVGEGAFTFVTGSQTYEQDIVLDESYNGAQVKIALFRESDHAQIATSNVLTLSVTADEAEQPVPGPGEEPVTPAMPTSPVGPLTDEQLAAAERGTVVAPDYAVAPGATFDVELGAARAGTWNQVWLHSEPLDLGWTLADADGTVSVTVPLEATAGDHVLVVLAEDGSVIGWDDLAVAALAAAPDAPAAPGAVPAADGQAGAQPVRGTDGDLAFTGAELAPAVAAGLLLLVAGGAALALRRRRAGEADETV